MVALKGRGWVLAPCLVELMKETDRLFPERSTASDGSVSSAAHRLQNPNSDHDPDGGFVRAVDITDDDAHGCDVQRLVDHLVRTKDSRVKYLIHKGAIWKAYPNRGLPAWVRQPYTGANAHDHHLHVSIRDGQERTRGAWWPVAEVIEEDDMFDDKDRVLLRRVHDMLGGAGLPEDRTKRNIVGRVDALYLDMLKGKDADDIDTAELVALIKGLPDKTVDAIKARL